MISRLFSAVLAGYLVSLSFEQGRWYLAILALVIVLWQIDRSNLKQRLLFIFIFGFVYFLFHLSWMRVIGDDAWIGITLISLAPWLLLALVKYERKRILSTAIIGAVTVFSEVLRSHFPWGGFPWGLIAYSQVDGPLAWLARYGGSALVTFTTVVIAGLVLKMLTNPNFNVVVLFLLVAFGISLKEPVTSNESLKVVAIQGNVPRLGLDLTSQRQAVLNNHVSVTESYLTENRSVDYPKLIIWPESSTDIDPLTNQEVNTKISKIVNESGIPILVGATIWGTNPDGPRNSGILWTTSGPSETYVKNHLVPFGEYIPLRNFLSSFIDRIQLVPNDFVPGNELGLFKTSNVVFGDVICFEIAFGDTVRQLVNEGSKFITVQTNNATYGRTNQPEQQFAISRFRAIEHQRSIIVASTSGISGAIDQNGNVLAKTDVFVPAVVIEDLPIVSAQSFSDRYPRWVSILSAFVTLFVLGRSLVKRKIA